MRDMTASSDKPNMLKLMHAIDLTEWGLNFKNLPRFELFLPPKGRLNLSTSSWNQMSMFFTEFGLQSAGITERSMVKFTGWALVLSRGNTQSKTPSRLLIIEPLLTRLQSTILRPEQNITTKAAAVWTSFLSINFLSPSLNSAADTNWKIFLFDL